MQRFASIFTLVAFLAMASAEAITKPEAPALPGPFAAYRVVSAPGAATASKSNNSNSNGKTVEFEPAFFVNDPSTAGKRYKSNACDTCSLCLSRTGGMSNKLTSDSVYREGTYEIIYKEAAIEKCLNSRPCQACEVKSKTVTFPATEFNASGYASLPPLFRNTDFPAGSYLLNMDVDATLVDGTPFFYNDTDYQEGSNVYDFVYVFAKPNTNPPEAFAATGYVYSDNYFYVPLDDPSYGCYSTETFPKSCSLSTPYTLCNRYHSVFSSFFLLCKKEHRH